ncbi:hypothetical protein [Georgenia sp. SUBG003]|uniref:hypothetical protein n=1 Tax=Georgenia sp. SUBG003 TaxID=1497974 RepID=UPI0004DAFF3D|nr:hypothetical protein DA06_13225 [Georgenia sp. SUBG003]
MSEESWSVAPVSTSAASTTAVSPETTATGPSMLRRHGPSTATAEIAAAMSAVAVSTTAPGLAARHHGSRLAR